jgi:hypothetical protein
MAAVSELKSRLQDLPDLPGLSEIDLPRMEQLGRNAGRSADETIDRLLGRSRNPIWNWLAVGLGLAILAGVIAAYMAWMRRPVGETTTAETAWKPEAEWKPEGEWKPETAAETSRAGVAASTPEVDVSRLDA